jgi:hypothetical protein
LARLSDHPASAFQAGIKELFQVVSGFPIYAFSIFSQILSESGKRTYDITARRMTSGKVLK